jgi:hypothetical protein
MLKNSQKTQKCSIKVGKNGMDFNWKIKLCMGLINCLINVIKWEIKGKKEI